MLEVGVEISPQALPSVLGSGAGPFADAVLWLDTARSAVVGGKLKNLGTGGSALDATFGSTAPSAYFDGSSLVLPGVAGNYASTPDAPALDITGNLCLVADVAPTDWTPGSTVRLGGKDNAYVLNLNTTGQLALTYVDSGLAVRNAATSGPVGFTDGVRRQVAVTYVAGTGVNDVRFWTRSTSSDPWVQLGSTQSSGGVDIRVGGNAAAFGATDTGTAPLAGQLYRFAIYASVGASNEPPSSGAVLDADFAKPFDTTSFVATTGQTITLNRTTSGVDANDPTLLTYEGTNYLYCPGAVNNVAAVTDTPELGLVDANAEWVVRFRANSLANGPLLTSKPYGGTGHWVQLNTNGSVTLGYLEVSAPTTIRAGASNAGAYVVGTDAWIKVRRNYLTGLIEFYTAPDQPTEPTVWTAVGTSSPAAGSFIDNTNNFNMGGDSTSANLDGRLYRVIVRNTTLGTTVLDVDFTTGITSGGQASFTATTGQTVFLQRTISGRRLVGVTRPVALLGADDYFEVPDSPLLNFGATDLGTVIAVVRLWNTEAAGIALVNKRDATAVAPAGPGWNLRIGGGLTETQFVTYDGTTSPQASPTGGWTAGQLCVHGGLLDGANNLQLATRNTTIGSTITSAVNTLTNTQTVRIGALSNGASPLNGELLAVAVFRRVLTAADLATIVAYYGAS